MGLENPKALAIKDELVDYYGAEINHGRLSPNPDSLVEKGNKDDRTNEYAITTRGEREIESRREWEETYVGKLFESVAA